MEESKYNDQYASLTEYVQGGNNENTQLNDNDHDDSDISEIEYQNDIGRGRKTANDLKQWIFVVKKTNTNLMNKKGISIDNIDDNNNNDDEEKNENAPLLSSSANDALNALHEAQTRNTLEMDIRATGTNNLHIY